MKVSIANRLTELRKQKGLSQEELAEQLNTSRQAISKWERGEAFPDIDNLLLLADFYEISLDALVRGVPDKERSIQPVSQRPPEPQPSAPAKAEVDPAPPKQTEKAASPQPLHARCRNPETLAFQVMRGIVFPALVLASYLYCMVFSCTIASPATGGFYHIFQIISAVQYRGFTLFTILIPITVLYAVQNRLARRTCGETGFMAEKKQYPLRIHLLRKLPFLCLLLMGWLAYSFLQDAASPFNILMACLSIFPIYCMLTDIISNILAISK